MWKYILKRLLALIPVVAGVILIVYLILNIAPGDPARIALGDEVSAEVLHQWREEHGLNDPILIRYLRYLAGFFTGDFGNSFSPLQTPVFDEIMARFPYTIFLSVVAMVITFVLAFPLGILAAIKQNTWFDSISMFVSLIGVSMPIFWLGMLLLLWFSLGLGWFPSFGADSFAAVVLPAVSLGFSSMASMARTTRSSMLEVVRQDYIRTARAKGIGYGRVIRKHAIRNSLIPTLTIAGIQIGNLLTGTVIVEQVFAWPGIGSLMIQSILARDFPMVLGCMVLFTLIFAIINLIVDLAYAYVDPRIRAQYS
ncbi:MAG: ABC transporter permease [Defluviitaleaceae bacterium]|nr:ABC transporter permease [Defluviitaleaceae bacterium]